ncbi:MAG: hypothetical protein KKH41_00875 [Candidatus Thermoplasmatota archaeon]|nr:hypothetical protein [Euryarchaeota archaeon]MBU4031433.1 hypothetical protein [Candidatus Thermoplasmatota archaeon]MBU4071098.1 hypothetical protein [Candidatus Thermoplasmatota archaeon]MBU4144980.1 hypothetical protein [Candidatus Thermoplasmatota archaeon]MBU4591114.1 hypothetical protein [Candidatus Thermoplasmatota archaeon]
MPVKNFEFMTIDSRRFSRATEVHKNIQIQVNHEITQVIERSDKETELGFRFAINYTGMGAIASIKLEGYVLFEGVGGIAQQWTKEKKLPDDVANEVLNLIMRNCIMQGVVLARDMRLPPPIQVPQVKVGQKAGAPQSSGMEVA